MQTRMRQLLIGLDAMEWDLVRKWASEGKLPTFTRLLDEGFSSELSTTAAQLPDTVWSCIYTGTNPAKFEKYFYVQYNPDTGGLENVPDDAIRGLPFWDFLSAAGRKVAVIDAPKFALSRCINGVQVTNWGAHATNTARASNPPSLIAEIDHKFGRHPVADCDKVDEKPESLHDLRRRILDGVRLHGEMFRWTMRQHEWDVFFGGFSAPHCVGHHFWSYLDEQHPRHKPGDPDGLDSTVEATYQAIDGEIAKMLEQAGGNIRCMIFAGHGMGAVYHASWNVMQILDLLGYGKPGSPIRRSAEAREAIVNPWRILKMMLPGKLQYAIKNSLPKPLQDELLFRWYAGARDWKGRKAFALPNNDIVAAVRINVKGRDKHGVVEPRDYDRVCRDIANALSELVDPVTGRSVIRQVSVLSDIFQGPNLARLPDICVLWEQGFPWRSVHSPRIGTLHIRRQDARSGSHTAHGFVIAAGAGVQAGSSPRIHSIYDIAPTVLEGAGLSVPAHMDGHPLPIVAGPSARALQSAHRMELF